MLIEPVEPKRAPAVVRRIYEALEKGGAPVSNLVKMLAHKPDVLRAYTQLSGAIWAESALSARSRSSPTWGPRSSTGAPNERAPTPLRGSGED